MIWNDQPVTAMKKTFKRHANECGLPQFTQYGIRHFMATYVRRAKPPVSKEQRDIWLGQRAYTCRLLSLAVGRVEMTLGVTLQFAR
jgi:hypothetical protein